MTYEVVSGGVAAMVLGRAKHAFMFDERPRTCNVKSIVRFLGGEKAAWEVLCGWEALHLDPLTKAKPAKQKARRAQALLLKSTKRR
jgi:hypothetical protein